MTSPRWILAASTVALVAACAGGEEDDGPGFSVAPGGAGGSGTGATAATGAGATAATGAGATAATGAGATAATGTGGSGASASGGTAGGAVGGTGGVTGGTGGVTGGTGGVTGGTGGTAPTETQNVCRSGSGSGSAGAGNTAGAGNGSAGAGSGSNPCDGLTVEYKATSGNGFYFTYDLRLTNTTGSAMDLSPLELRYLYSSEQALAPDPGYAGIQDGGGANMEFVASVGGSGNSDACATNAMTITLDPSPVDGQAVSELPAGKSVSFAVQVPSSGESDLTNDWSWDDLATDFVPAQYILASCNGELISGEAP